MANVSKLLSCRKNSLPLFRPFNFLCNTLQNQELKLWVKQ
jgi:hypothetical protein